MIMGAAYDVTTSQEQTAYVHTDDVSHDIPADLTKNYLVTPSF
jgi:hypothetical protein